MNDDIFNDVNTDIFNDKFWDNSPDKSLRYMRNLKDVAGTTSGKALLAEFMKLFRLYELSAGGTPEITARREGVRSCALLIFKHLKDAAPNELDEIISMTLE